MMLVNVKFDAVAREGLHIRVKSSLELLISTVNLKQSGQYSIFVLWRDCENICCQSEFKQQIHFCRLIVTMER